MRHAQLLLLALAVSWLSLSTADTAARVPAAAPGIVPQLMLWAWERPTDLRGLDPQVGVAFLAQTLTVGSGHMSLNPRRNPLHVSGGTRLVAVTRIESDASGAVTVADAERTKMAVAIARSASLPRVIGVQIDFDAVASERGFYRALIQDVRGRLGDGVPLSITALASWCAGDRWLSGLPIDEAVPMLFRMGPTNEPYAAIATTATAAAPECRGAIGTSLDEPRRARAAGRRVYVFNPAAWTPASIGRAREVFE